MSGHAWCGGPAGSTVTIPMRGNERQVRHSYEPPGGAVTIPMRGNEVYVYPVDKAFTWVTIPMRGNESRSHASSQETPWLRSP